MIGREATPNILVVDDQETITELLDEFLRSQGYECVTASSAPQALHRFEEQPFDVMFCDIQMPEMTGLDLLRTVKERGYDTTVVMVSALHDTRRAIDALRCGAYDYIVKPFQLDEVDFSLQRVLEHRRLVKENRLYQSNLENLVSERTQQLQLVNADLRDTGQRLSDTVDELYRTYRSTLGALAAALDLRDNETKGHSERVVAYSLRLGRQLGLSQEDLLGLEQGALLHDIGKIGVRDAVLLKPAKLTAEEWVEMRQHTTYGVQILKGVEFLRAAVPVVGQHHEFFDGSGYPAGLSGEEIHIFARIFSVADTLDAMTSNRPYRKMLSFEAAATEVQRCSGWQYDPRVVQAFLQVPLSEWKEIKERIAIQVSTMDLYLPQMQSLVASRNLAPILQMTSELSV